MNTTMVFATCLKCISLWNCSAKCWLHIEAFGSKVIIIIWIDAGMWANKEISFFNRWLYPFSNW